MTWLADLRYALRLLCRSPLFTCAVTASLALGLGANTVIFNLLDQVLLRPLPVKDPGQLVLLDAPGPNSGMFNGDRSRRLFSYPEYRSLRDRGRMFDGLIARFPVGVNFSYEGPAEAAAGELVSGNFFDVLGIRPALGRLLSPQDDLIKGAHPVAVMSYGFWMRRFGGDPAVVGKTVRVNSTPMTVIGVLPSGFFGVYVGRAPDLYVPMMMKAQMTPTWDMLEDRTAHWLHILGRVQNRAAAEVAVQVLYKPELEADITAMGSEPSPGFRQRFLEKKLLLQPASSGVPTFREEAGVPLWLLMAMVGLVLLIACANVANLMMARALGRRKEVAVRLAMGARRWDVVRQLLVESLLVSLLGAIAGIGLAAWTASLLVHNLPGDEGVNAITSDLDLRALAFAFALSLISVIIFGLLPAIRSTRPKIRPTLANQGTQLTGSLGHIRARRAFVIAQMALSLLLITGAGLFVRSLVNLRQMDPGFRTQGLVLFTIDASRNGYSQSRIRQLYATVRERIAAVPGVSAAALGDMIPLNGDHNQSNIGVTGTQAKQGEVASAYGEYVSPGFFATMGMALAGGRDFDGRDGADTPRVAIVNETFVRQFFPGDRGLGRKFAWGGGTPNIEIVGVVKDAKYDDLHNEGVRQVYFPFQQSGSLADMTVHVRTEAAPSLVMPALRAEMAQIDPNLALRDLTTMQDQLSRSLFGERILASLSAAFGAMATILACVGLYGVTAFSVARRSREIGIRMALGANRRRILNMVLKEVGWMCLIGVGLGLPAAGAIALLIQSQLYGLTATDPLTLAGSAALLVLVSFAAAYLPARRAASVEPNEVLRYE